MNISIHLNDAALRELNRNAVELNRSRSAIIREAVEEWNRRRQSRRWPESVQQFDGAPEIPPFEASRAALKPPAELLL